MRISRRALVIAICLSTAAVVLPLTLASGSARPTQQQVIVYRVQGPVTQPVSRLVNPPPTTTTTTAPPAPVQPASVPPAEAPQPAPAPQAVIVQPVDTSSAAAWAASAGVQCIRNAESGDNYSTNTGNGYTGSYQFSPSTWNEYVTIAGFPQYANGDAADAPPGVQDAAAYACWEADGWAPWPNTSRACGL